MKNVIHTSERKTFKTCRQNLDVNSPNRMALEPNREAQALRLGTAIHAGLEVLYEPTTWNVDRTSIHALALLAFIKAYPAPDGDDNWEAEVALGKGMLEAYFSWARTEDIGLTPLSVEQKFEVELQLTWPMLNEPTFYAGRLDAIVQDRHGDYWIMDHKTAGKFDPEEFLVMDEQVTSYCWAMQHVLGIPIAGFIYNELRKDVAHPPEVLKNGTLSKNKQQNTTHDLYLAKIRELGQEPFIYNDILEHLLAQGNKFFRRTFVRRSPRELQLAGDRIVLEASDMLNDPSIYPNPDRHCTWCSFKAPCLARMDGSDYEWILTENFHKKVDD